MAYYHIHNHQIDNIFYCYTNWWTAVNDRVWGYANEWNIVNILYDEISMKVM